MSIRQRWFRFHRAASLAAALCLAPQPGSPAAERFVPARLSVIAVEGEAAVRETGKRAAKDFVVRVEDEEQRPVADAAVQFVLPASGPGGVFPGGGRILEVRTDSHGRAAAKGLRANGAAGTYIMEVTAAYDGVSAKASFTQINVASSKGGGKIVAIAAAIGGAAAVGAVLATRKSGGSQSATPAPSPGTTITAGTPSVGGPP